jgi:Epoxide hydrolase N terminus
MSSLEPAGEIRSFHVDTPQAELDELRGRIAATRWPERETVADESQGVQLTTMQELVRYWGTEYDFRRFEARLNALPQFITEIDGLDIHFIHVPSPHENALPLIITHGWPGSVVEMLNVIGPLSDPTAHGGDAEDAFDVVVPSVPGYGFSGKPQATGLGPRPYRGGLDRADEAPGIHAIRRAGRRLGRADHGCDDIAAAFDGHPVGNLTRDEVLDNITMTWVTNTGISSGRLYWENTLGFFDIKGATVPAAVSVFPRELYHAPRSWTEKAYPNLIYFNEVDEGNHFAAWQEPDIFTTEVRAAFRSLR